MRIATRTLLISTTCLAFGAVSFAQDGGTDPTAEENQVAAASTRLDRLTVFADRQSTDPLDHPGNITVLTGEEFESRFITDMQELVRHQPGIVVQRQTTGTDPFNTFGGFTIRGVGGNRVQMLVDGSRIPERILDGTRDYLDFNFTKQADIVRGPSSVLWGADALGGIVALETVDPEDIIEPGRASGGVASTSFDSLDNELNTSVTYAHRLSDTVSVLGGVAYTRADEAKFSNARADGGIYGCPRNIAFGATPCNELDPTDKSSWRGLGKVVITPNDDHRIELSADYLRRKTDVQYDHVLGPVFSTVTGLPTGEVINDYDRNLDLHRGRFAIEHDWQVGGSFIDNVEWTLAYSPSGYERTGTRSSVSAAGDRVITEDYLSYRENFLEFDLQLTSRFQTGPLDHEVTWGFDGDLTKTDYKRIDTTRNLTAGTVTETRAGGFNFANATTRRADFYIQDKITAFDGRLELTPGLRFAHYDIDPRPDADYQPVPGSAPVGVASNAVLFNLGGVLHLTETYSAYAAFNQGFKMPTAQQLYTSLPGAFFDLIPAPDLRPERVNNYEIGVRGEYDRGHFSVGGFYADYTDFIESFYNPPGTTNYTYRNLSSVQIYGIEASGQYEVTDRLRMDFSLAWQTGDQKATPTAAKRPYTVPPLTGIVGVAYDIAEYNLTLEAVGTFAGALTRTSSATDFKPGGYALLDVFATWKPSENSVLRLGVKNVFDQRYFLPSAASYSRTASASVARTNPLELQTGAGRTYMASYTLKF